MKLALRKNKGLIFLYLLSMGLIFSQENNMLVYIDHPLSVIVFENDNKIMIVTRDLQTDINLERNGIYTTSIKNGITFIDVTWDNNTYETFLMLSNDVICFLYREDNPNPYVLGFSGGFNRGEFIFRSPTNIWASSYLVENDSLFSPEQINQRLGVAWIEGAHGQGIHEKLFINPNVLAPQLGCTALHISIGFISFERPYLYEENSRPKRINISVAGKFNFIFDLIDTPNFQTIKLPQRLEENDTLEIEILEVYPGTKFEDTCINNILYDTVPLERSLSLKNEEDGNDILIANANEEELINNINNDFVVRSNKMIFGIIIISIIIIFIIYKILLKKKT